MSQWRRFALQEVPSCKSVIEAAENPSQMWSRLWDEFLACYEEIPEAGEKAREIYGFALRCSKEPVGTQIYGAVCGFFHYLIGAFVVGNVKINELLPKLMTSEEFDKWIEAFGDYYWSDEQIAEVRKRFFTAKHLK